MSFNLNLEWIYSVDFRSGCETSNSYERFEVIAGIIL
jgi:hypothetical protein